MSNKQELVGGARWMNGRAGRYLKLDLVVNGQSCVFVAFENLQKGKDSNAPDLNVYKSYVFSSPEPKAQPQADLAEPF